jgi:hypothetical protein
VKTPILAFLGLCVLGLPVALVAVARQADKPATAAPAAAPNAKPAGTPGATGTPPAPAPDAKARRLRDVTSFGIRGPGGHPNWAILESKTPDSTALRFGHATHMPGAGGAVSNQLKQIMDAESKAGTKDRTMHIDRVGEGTTDAYLAMNCTYCHVTDEAGQYMKPVRYDAHCADCHSGSTGYFAIEGAKRTVELSDKPIAAAKPKKADDDEDEEPAKPAPAAGPKRLAERIIGTAKVLTIDPRKDAAKFFAAVPLPHAEAREAAAVIDAQLAKWVAANPGAFETDFYAPAAAPPKPKGDDDEDEEDAKPKGPVVANETAKSIIGGKLLAPYLPSRPADAKAQAEWIAKQRAELMKTLLKADNCAYCHTETTAPDTATGLFEVKNSKITDRWLNKSEFSHVAHGMVKCTECHVGTTAVPPLAELPANATDAQKKAHAAAEAAAKEENTRRNQTSRVMLPDVASCQDCHAPSSAGGTNAPHECVLCHTFHTRLPDSVQGSRTIEEIRAGGRVIKSGPRQGSAGAAAANSAPSPAPAAVPNGRAASPAPSK